jgi:transposase
MGKPYSDDLRERVVASMVGGRSCREAGAIYNVAPSTAGNWYRQYQRSSSVSPKPMGGDRRWKLGNETGWLSDRLEGKNDLTLSDVRGELAARGIIVSYASVWRTVHRLGLTFKKKRYTPANRIDPMSL